MLRIRECWVASTDSSSSSACSPRDVPLLQIETGFWHRTGTLRAKVLAKSRKARFADSLIARKCVEAGVSLITREREFRAFAQAAGLQLLLLC